MRTALIVALLATAASAASAQHSNNGFGMPATVSTAVTTDSAVPRVAVQQIGVTPKDPTIAGVLSFLIPGLGSFYAGNNAHGIIHLGVHIGSYALMVGSATSCGYYGDCTGNASMVGLGALALIGNDVWSIFTAVHDAHAVAGAAPPGRIVGSLYFNPSLVQPSERVTPGTRAVSNGLQVLQLHF